MGVLPESLLTDRFPQFAQLVQKHAASKPTLLTASEAHGKAKLLAAQRDDAAAEQPQGPGGGFMREFFSDISRMQASLERGRKVVKGMGTMIDIVLMATTQDKERSACACLDKAAEEVRALLSESKAILERLKEKSDTEEVGQPGSAQGKIRSNMQLAMARKHQQLLEEFQRVQIDLKKVLEQRQQREMMLLMPHASKEEVRHMIQDGETCSHLIMQKMAGAHAAILDEVRRIRDKHSDIRKLEQSIAELAQMFQEVAVLVDAQGEMLDCIEINVHSTKSFTAKAQKELVTTGKVQRNTKKWTCCAMMCMALVAVAVFVPVIIRVV